MSGTERVLRGARAYDVEIGAGVRRRAGPRLAGTVGTVLLVTDRNVGPLHAGPVAETLREVGIEPLVEETPAGAAAKTRDVLARLHDALAAAGAGRDAVVVAVGGGSVSDVAGLAAATWMRGVGFAIVPTTLLAMADASVGGKTAIDLPAGRNLVGAFHQPRFVLCDPETLATLPDAEWRSGLGEVVKTAVVGDADLFRRLEERADEVAERRSDLVVEAIRRCVRTKAAIVTRDEREAGERRLLNLGHTLGHALEAETGFTRLCHGEAVAIGLAFAARLAVSLGRLRSRDAARIERLLVRLGLPHEVPEDVSREALAERIPRDKKARGHEPVWILPTAPGRCEATAVPGWREAVVEGLLPVEP